MATHYNLEHLAEKFRNWKLILGRDGLMTPLADGGNLANEDMIQDLDDPAVVRTLAVAVAYGSVPLAVMGAIKSGAFPEELGPLVDPGYAVSNEAFEDTYSEARERYLAPLRVQANNPMRPRLMASLSQRYFVTYSADIGNDTLRAWCAFAGGDMATAQRIIGPYVDSHDDEYFDGTLLEELEEWIADFVL